VTAALRPATPADLPAIDRLSAAFFPRPEGGWSPHFRRYVHLRHERSLQSDPGGAWVADDAGGLAGVAMAIRAEGIWVLSLLGVHPEQQGTGLGRLLFDAALGYGEGCRGFMIGASDRPAAIGLYARAGFRVHPAMTASGQVRRAALPALPDVRPGGRADLEGHCAEVDRAVRGGARTGALESLAEMGFRLHLTPGGYAFGAPDGLRLLAARDEAEATQLLWSVLAATTERASVSWLDGRQEWAFRVVLAAGLSLSPDGPYLTRGELGPLWPWIPHGALL
jgi:GNAT superfamily N-acetyltransferase